MAWFSLGTTPPADMLLGPIFTRKNGLHDWNHRHVGSCCLIFDIMMIARSVGLGNLILSWS